MNKRNGWVALTTILIISGMLFIIATTVALSGVGEQQSTFSNQKGLGTFAFVEGCTEDALQKVRDSSSYAGGTVTHPEGTCDISVSSSGNNRTITVTTTAANFKKTIQVQATRSNSLTVTSWVEL